MCLKEGQTIPDAPAISSYFFRHVRKGKKRVTWLATFSFLFLIHSEIAGERETEQRCGSVWLNKKWMQSVESTSR